MSNNQLAEAPASYHKPQADVLEQGRVLPEGYKQTEVGVIPEDWEVKTLDKVCKINQGLQIAIEKRKSNPSKASKIYITIQFLNADTAPEYIDEYTPSVCCQDSDILMTRTGNTGIVVTGVKGVFHNNFFKVNYDKKQINKDFFVYFLRSSDCQKTIIEKAGTSTIPDLNHKDFYSIYVGLPFIEEQTAIANALSDIDALINAQQKLTSKKQAIKTATMQQLLTGRTRLPPFAHHSDGTKKGYKQTELGEVPEDWVAPSMLGLTRNIIDYRGRTPKKLGMGWGGGNIVALSAGNVKKGYIDFNSESYLGSEELYKRWMISGETEKDDIVFTMEAPLGNVALIPDSNKYILSQRTILLQVDRSKYNPIFIFQVLLSDDFQSYISDSATGSTAQGIKRTTFEKLRLALPSNIIEQTAIATILSDMDEEIQTLQQRLNKTRQIKQGMMQELLTGKTRLVKEV